MGFALYALAANHINVPDLCRDVFQALTSGRGPNSPVLTLAGLGGGEGKSFFLKGLVAVFGAESVFFTPTHPAFPLMGPGAAKVAFLDDFRFFQTPVPVATQCLWFDGSPLPTARPQNTAGQAGQDLYRGSAPVFITTKGEDVEKLAGARDGDASMLLRRLKVYRFTTRVLPPPARVPDCGHCFAKLVCSHGM